MSIFDEAKIDCHTHVLDPARFPFGPDTPYRPSGQEIAPLSQFLAVLDTFQVQHALLVGPNSGYGTDNRCLLDALQQGQGRFKGVAVVANDVGFAELARLKAAGIVGIAFNPTFHGVEYYLHTEDLLAKLVDLDLFLQIQTEGDQLLRLLPLLETSPVRLLFDHCGRPVVEGGVGQAGFQALLALGRERRAAVKLSGYAKFSREPHPYRDAWPYIRALVDAFTLDSCLWASDWPFLRAPERVDYGPLLTVVERLFRDAADRRKLLVETPRRLFGFAEGGA